MILSGVGLTCESDDMVWYRGLHWDKSVALVSSV